MIDLLINRLSTSLFCCGF